MRLLRFVVSFPPIVVACIIIGLGGLITIMGSGLGVLAAYIDPERWNGVVHGGRK